MGRFGVTLKKEAELIARMAACGLDEGNILERFTCSGGPGGQKVNRTATCVYLCHKPTGIEVKMQEARSQALNRFYARRRLCELIENAVLGGKSPEAREQAKIRRQKERRKRRNKPAAQETTTQREE